MAKTAEMIRRRESWTGVLFGGMVVLAVFLSASFAIPSSPASRSVEFEETVIVDSEGKSLRVWMPIPRSTEYQKVELVSVSAPTKAVRTKDPDFGNEMLFFDLKPSGPVEITARYRITVKERRMAGRRSAVALTEGERALYTEPRGLVVIDDEIRRVSRDAVGNETEPMKIGRRLYDTVLARMEYDKDIPGWGRGDSVRACKRGKGNCTDFHSLFMALARARALPARFIMGLPLPTGKEEADLRRGYHCWTEFHVDGKGWVPADISEAWKDRSKRDYLFGNLDENRIVMTFGRDILLEPPQAGERLNYFAFPNVEIAGRPYKAYELKRIVRKLSQSQSKGESS